MSRSLRVGWTVSPVSILACAFSIGLVLSAFASEPEGHIRLSTEWVGPSSSAGPPVIRLRLEPLVPLDDIELTVTMPVDFAVTPRTAAAPERFQPVPVGPDRRALRASLPASSLSFHDFELILPPNGYGVLEFFVEGRDASGKSFRNAIGVATGESPPAGVQRMGAMEYRAVVLPPEER